MKEPGGRQVVAMTTLNFTEQERAYLEEQRIAHIATVDSNTLQPDVAPVGFEFDGEHIHVAGYDLQHTLKYRNVRDNPLVAVVIADLASIDPWRPRGLKVHGRAVTMLHGGREVITITPLKKWSWGINAPAFADNAFNLRVES
jgi:pyridoxamine 5'-phosphate oxidase family protein